MDPQFYPPPPVQQPRLPIWVVGVWPRMKSMRRVLKGDGLLPTKMDSDGQAAPVQPADIREMKAYIDSHRPLTTPFDIVVDGQTLGMSNTQMADKLLPWVEAGATWWVEAQYGVGQDQVVARLLQGPPRLG
ncbi:MAG: hypothetical protein JW953_04610 [Anaerolineae bacterium]|nr:hypothetical protein [Anaerolineae bacterium]